MTNKQTTRHLFTVLLMLLLGTFSPAALVRAQKPAAATPSSPAGGPKEGIKVHGRWTIDIRNPDGKLVTHHEFKNALLTSGAESLGQFLQRTSKAGEWKIVLVANLTSNYACKNQFDSPMFCSIFEPASQSSDSSLPHAFRNLTIASQGGANVGTVLAGSATAARNGVIDTVFASVARCPVDTGGVCSPNWVNFTSRDLATPINVVAGQIIQVTVVISFS